MSLWRYYLAGGGMMHVISLCALGAGGTIAYQLWVFRGFRLDLDEFLSRVRAALLKRDPQAALRVCSERGAPVAAILRAGLQKLSSGRSRAEAGRTMENAALHEIARLERYLPLLAAIAALAPLAGFAGTVAGMIAALEAIDDPAAVGAGLGRALGTTAWGLVVAGVAQPFHVYFQGRLAACARQIEIATNVLDETLDELDAGAGGTP